MNNGIDLDAIPGQKAARNRRVVQNPPSKPKNVSNTKEILPANLEMYPIETEILPEQTTITYTLDLIATFHNMVIDTTILDPMFLQFETGHHYPNPTITINKTR